MPGLDPDSMRDSLQVPGFIPKDRIWKGNHPCEIWICI